MRIDNHKIFSNWANELGGQKSSNKEGLGFEKQVKTEKDSIQVSKNAIDMNRFLDMVAEDEIRLDKVERIRKEMENGTYAISGKDVVAKLLGGNENGKGIDSTI